ncbi:heterokaryon incompatibility [Stachybotrys elegans]|uniref:Heterokaryon incompatibility n=1 Tax=Stachybotrys elegans TaxID=80388 RepID=A0A8K0SS57_9HYPO|nr:heterokaryon incompatibility [Stachybotrys elegans]
MDDNKPCQFCTVVCTALEVWEKCLVLGARHLYPAPVDFFLGTSVEFEARASDGCMGCRSLLAAHDTKSKEEKYGKVYGVSLHFSASQPLVFTKLGNLNGDNRDLARRRNPFGDLSGEMFLSTNPILATNPMGRGRPYDRDSYNTSLFKRWIKRCDEHHQSTCSGKYEKFLLPEETLTFIDVEERCIVTPETPVRYAALSYVWGGAKVPLSTKANVPYLRLPGAFLAGGMELPATINDAVRLCASIGIRYLWVDSLCIVQDDLETKMKHIKAMGSVYANAYLTLVPLSAESAVDGISRVSRPAPSPNSSYVYLATKTLMRATQGSIGLGPITLSNTTWRTRAWTLQELVFSKRVIGLGPVASWVCSGAQWSEDLELPSEIEGQSAFTEKKPDKPSVVVSPSLSDYASLAQLYAKRDMTLSSDTLNAFEGIMIPMSQWFPNGFLFGIPEFIFDMGLLWDYRRRGAQSRSGVGWENGSNSFPSWSWISYKGSHLQTFWYPDFSYPQPSTVTFPLVKWKKQEKATGAWKDIDNSYHRVRKHFENPEAPIPDGWTKHENGDEPPYYQHSSHDHVTPQPKFSYPIPPFQRYRDINSVEHYPHVLFEGSLTRVKFQFFESSEQYNSYTERLQSHGVVPEMDIVNPVDGSWIGRLRLNLQQGDSIPDNEQVQEIIAISEGKQKNSGSDKADKWSELSERDEIKGEEWYHYVNVLWIGWTKDEKIYRKALGRVWYTGWQKLELGHVRVLLI